LFYYAYTLLDFKQFVVSKYNETEVTGLPRIDADVTDIVSVRTLEENSFHLLA